MKSEPYPVAIKVPHESGEYSSDVDDPSQSENELEIVTSAEEGKKDEGAGGGGGGQRENNGTCGNYQEGENFTPHMSPQSVNINSNFFFEELTPDDEILTFQCPNNFDVNSLLDQVLDMNKVTKIKDSGNKFKCQVLANDKKTLTCIFPSRTKNASLVKLPVAGHILIKQSVKLPKKKFLVEEVEQSDKIKIRDSVVRHPLLGKNWNEHLRTVRKQIKKQKKVLRKSMEHRKSLVKAEKERKEQKKILKAQLSQLKKTLGTDTV